MTARDDKALVPLGRRAPEMSAAGLPWFADDEHMMTVLETRAEGQSVDEWIAKLSGATATRAGISMSPEQAVAVATVFACLRVIGEDVAKLPRHLMRRISDGKRRRTEKATNDPRFDLLALSPNDWMTGQELVEYMLIQAALHGVAYAYTPRDAEGRVTEILPLLPGSVTAHQDASWGLTFRITGYGPTSTALPQDLWRLNGVMFDPVAGAPVGTMAREAVGLAAALEASQARFHAGDARPAGILTSKQVGLTPEQRVGIKDAWNKAYGPGGRGGIAVLDAEFEFKPITATAADSQVIQNREFQIEEICRFFRVHPWAVMRQQSSQSYGSLEQTARAHLEQTLMPWVTRLEQTARRDLLTRTRQRPGIGHNGGQALGDIDRDTDRDLFLRVNVDAIARSTLTDRVNAYSNAVKVYMTPNEVRELEDRDPIDDDAMDRVQLQVNNTALPQTVKPAGTGTPAATPKPTPITQTPTGA